MPWQFRFGSAHLHSLSSTRSPYDTFLCFVLYHPAAFETQTAMSDHSFGTQHQLSFAPSERSMQSTMV